jgi:membrane-associated phospholipid phosphatase
MNRKIMAIFLSAVVILVSCRYLDYPIALLFKGLAVRHRSLAPNLPDLLLLVVLVATLCLWVCYLYRYRRGIDDTRTRFFRLAAWTVPLTFVLKSLLKLSFGRVNTRFWLDNQAEPGFILFGGGDWHNGFPSGHMAVVTAFMVSVWLFYPRLRPVCLVLLVGLGVALMATNYHFLGDVLAGAWLGVMVNVLVVRCLDMGRGEQESA